MRARWILGGVAIGVALSLSFGFAFADRSATPVDTPASGSMYATCDAMHDSPAMERMHAQMPAEWRAQCDAMHAQMGQMMGGAGQMGAGMMTDGATGGGMMAGGMGSGMVGHHGAGWSR